MEWNMDITIQAIIYSTLIASYLNTVVYICLLLSETLRAAAAAVAASYNKYKTNYLHLLPQYNCD